MPPLLAILPTIAAIAGIAGTGISLGETLSNLPGGTPTPAPPTQAQNDANAVATRKAQETSVSSAFPTLQAQTGGSLSPEATVQLATLLTNNAGAPGIGASTQDLISKLLGGGNTVTAGSASSGSQSQPGLSSFSV